MLYPGENILLSYSLCCWYISFPVLAFIASSEVPLSVCISISHLLARKKSSKQAKKLARACHLLKGRLSPLVLEEQNQNSQQNAKQQ